MKIIFYSAFLFLLCQCANPSAKEKGENNSEILLPANIVLTGNGESDIAGYYNEWSIKIKEDNTLELLCSQKEDSADSRSMNRQYFGHLLRDSIYTYKIVIDKALYVDDCNKYKDSYNKIDTIPIYIEADLFKEIKYWDLKIENSTPKDTFIRITKPYYAIFYAGHSELSLTLYPEKGCGYYPVSIKSHNKCAIQIGNLLGLINKNYYLNRNGNSFELITDITPYVNFKNKKCDYCIKKTALRLIK